MSPSRGPEVHPSLARALERASAEGSADVVVETASTQATLFFSNGGLAWIVANGAAAGLLDILERRSGVPRRAIAAALRAAGSLDGLVTTGALPLEAVRSALGEHNARHLAHLLAAGPPLDVRVLPASRPFVSGIVFSLDELLTELAPSRDATRGTLPRSSGALRAMPTRQRLRRPTADMLAIGPAKGPDVPDLLTLQELDGFVSATIMDERGTLAAISDEALPTTTPTDGAATNGHVVLEAEGALAREVGADVEEVIVTTARHYFLVRPVTRAPHLVLCLLVDRALGNLAAARFALRATALERAS